MSPVAAGSRSAGAARAATSTATATSRAARPAPGGTGETGEPLSYTASPAPRTEIRPLTDREFTLFQTLIHREAGIYLAPVKKPLLVRRLSSRLRELGLTSFSAYYRLAKQPDHEERIELLDRICTNETHFFREPRQFELLSEGILPAWFEAGEAGRRPRRVRAWSAACSTGEEPYSIAMALLGQLRPEAAAPAPSPLAPWHIEVLGTDLSTRALATARQATWPIERSARVPPELRRRFMLKGVRSQAGKVKAGPELRSVVHLERLNLNGDSYPVRGGFDLIFCRNVLIYFDVQSRRRIVDLLVERLMPGGYLFLGHAENLSGRQLGLRGVIPCVYTRVDP
jgi:chemotaxis protein methyltransferase CheR